MASQSLLELRKLSIMQVCQDAENAVDRVMQALAVPYARMVSMQGDELVVEVRFLGRGWSRRYHDPERLRAPRVMGEILSDPLKEWAVRGRATTSSILNAKPTRTMSMIR
jgi:hypothetical protein